MSAKPRGGWRRTGAMFLAVAATLVVAAHARAEEYNPPIRTLVKNADQLTEQVVLLNASQDGLHQGFRTGPNLGGYQLTSILLYVENTHGSRYMTIDAGVYTDEESGFTRVASLTRGQLNDYADNEWWAPENTYLEPDTDYYFLLDCTAGCANDNVAQFRTTYSSEDDPGAEEGWDIDDHCGFRSAGDPNWHRDSRRTLRIEIRGRPSYHRAYRTEIVSTPGSGDTYMVGENIDIALTFNTPVDMHQGKPYSYIGIQVGDVAGLAVYWSGSFTTQLIYRYEVQIDDADANGISVDEGGPNTGFVGPVPTLVGSFGSLPVDRYYPGVADDPSHKVDGLLHCIFLEDGSPDCNPPETSAVLSVADVRTTEEADATLEFTVMLSRADSETVTVDYATADGTAQAGQDYTATDGTLTFAAGETQKTVSVAVLDDAHDEGEETLTLTLSNASGAHIADNVATGTIENDDPLQQAWLARFGRTAAQRVLDSVQARLRAPHQAGIRAIVAGRDLSGVAQYHIKTQSEWVRSEATEVQVGPKALTIRDLMTGSAFTLGSETVGGLGTLWGRGAYSGFDGGVNGLALDGGVMTGMFGADYAIGRWVLGLPLSHSRGDGNWRSADLGEGRMSSSLTGLYPYAGYELTERLSLWGTAGHGQGDLALMMQGGESYHTNMDLTMAAVGVRGDLVSARQAGGWSLAVESDALLVRTTSAAATDPSGLLASAVGDVSRLRLGLEGSLDWSLAGGRSLTPTIELGLRHDGGDAETGFGVEVGGGSVFVDAGRGLMAQVAVRGLVAHETSDFRDWRVSGSLRFDPTPSSALGPAVALTPSWGAPSSGGVAALLGRETLAGLSAHDAASVGRLDAEAAYGLAVFGGRATGTPYVRVGQSEAFREIRMGCRLELLRWEGLEMGIEGTQRGSTGDNRAPDREVMLHLALSAP